MENELKPCPFCGGKAYLEKSSRGFVKAKPTKVAFVRCTVCDARSTRFDLAQYGRTSKSKEANAEAIKAWNGRAEDGNFLKRVSRV